MITEIIPKVPTDFRAEWKAAADNWRFPYWDWAQKKSRPDNNKDKGKDSEALKFKLVYDIPLIAKEAQIVVLDYQHPERPLELLAPIGNPMFKFTMPGGAQMGSFGIGDVQQQQKNKRFFTVPVSA